jgi:hypothetical protein
MAAYDLAADSTPLATLEEAITRRGPCLIHAEIDVNEAVFPIVPPGAANRDMLESTPESRDQGARGLGGATSGSGPMVETLPIGPRSSRVGH